MANYIPPCIYQLPPWLGAMICAQGLTNTSAWLTAEVAGTSNGSGGYPHDAARSTILNSYLTIVAAAIIAA